MESALRSSHAVTLALPDEAATLALAARVAELARPRDVIALKGELGVGKTTFARGFISALPRPDGGPPEEVPSPTFTLLQIYEREPASVYHLDLYRIERAEEAVELGIEEAFAEGITLIEWPERLGRLLPLDHLEVRLAFAPGGREARLRGGPSWSERLARIGGNW